MVELNSKEGVSRMDENKVYCTQCRLEFCGPDTETTLKKVEDHKRKRHLT